MFKMHLIIFVLALVLPFLVQRAGALPVLTFVDYRKIDRPADFNRYAGTRLFAVAAMALLCLLLTAMRPEFGIPLLFLEVLAVAAAANWIAQGTPRFTRRRLAA